MIKVYHSSPDNIDEFIFTNGVHVGGKYSSITAGLRKLRNLKTYKNLKQNHINIYEFELDSSIPFYECNDVGGNDAWLVEILKAKSEGYSVIKYKNKYEPDTVPSYIILDNNIIQLKNITTLSL